MVFDLSYLIVQYTTGLQILKVRDAIALFLCGTLGTKGFFSVLLFHPLLLAGLAFRDTVDASLSALSPPPVVDCYFLLLFIARLVVGTEWFLHSHISVLIFIQTLCTFTSGWNFLNTFTPPSHDS